MENWNKLIGTTELARIVADINSDGHLQIRGNSGLTSFNSNDLDSLFRHKDLMESLFNIIGRIYLDKRREKIRYKVFFISKELALFLSGVGVIEGNKTKKIFFVPEWIKKGSKNVKASFLRGFYDSEGSIFPTRQKNSKPRWRITLKQHKEEDIKEYGKRYMEEIREMVLYFNIKASPVRQATPTIRKDGSVTMGHQFDVEKSSFKNFYKYISFDNKDKQNKLIGVLNNSL